MVSVNRRSVAVAAIVALAALATVGISWCVAAVAHQVEHCHSCGSSMGMDVGEHLAWWQDQVRSTPAVGLELGTLGLLLLLAAAVVPLTVAVQPLLVDVRFRRQRFRPPGASYLDEMLADGILNPKVFPAAR